LGALAQAFARGGRHSIVGAPLFAHFAKGEYQTAEGEAVYPTRSRNETTLIPWKNEDKTERTGHSVRALLHPTVRYRSNFYPSVPSTNVNGRAR